MSDILSISFNGVTDSRLKLLIFRHGSRESGYVNTLKDTPTVCASVEVLDRLSLRLRRSTETLQDANGNRFFHVSCSDAGVS